MIPIKSQNTAVWFALALIFVFSVSLFAYCGNLEKGLRFWVDNYPDAAILEFSSFANTDQLAELNLLTAQGIGLLDSLEELLIEHKTNENLDKDRTSSALGNSFSSYNEANQIRIPLTLNNLAIEAVKDSLHSIVRQLEVISKVNYLTEYAMYQSACFNLGIGNNSAALANVKLAYKKNPKQQRTSSLMLNLLFDSGDFDELESKALHQISVRPDNPVAWWALGIAEKRNNHPQRALKAWIKGLGLYPLEVMLKDGAILANEVGRYDLVLEWVKELRFRYSHKYDQKDIERLCSSMNAPWLHSRLGEFTEKKCYEDCFPQFFPKNREWHYKVSYGPIPLGQLIVGVKAAEEWIPDPGSKPRTAYRVFYRIESNPVYDWLIELDEYYEALIPEHCLSSLQFIMHSQIGKQHIEKSYTMDFTKGRILTRGYSAKGMIFSEDSPIPQQLFDGISLLYAARRQVLEQNYHPILTIVDEEAHRTNINDDGHEKKKIMGKTVPVVKIHGTADYEGIAGLTGEFWGAFTADQRALPVAASFQIRVGRISIILDEIKN